MAGFYLFTEEVCRVKLNIIITKDKIRKEVKRIRDTLSKEEIIYKSKAIWENLIATTEFKQANNMQENYSLPIFIIEGDFNEITRISNKTILSTIISLILKNNIRFLFSSSPKETAEILEILVKKEQVENNKEIALRYKTKKMTLKEMQQFFLEGLPGIGPKLAKNLLKKFKSPKEVINASKEELMKIDKLGPKKVKLIKKIIAKKN